LQLPAVTRLGPIAAEVLARIEGELSADGLHSLTNPRLAEKLLSPTDQDCIDIPRRVEWPKIVELSKEVAEVIARHANKVNLRGIREVTDEVLSILTESPFVKLSDNVTVRQTVFPESVERLDARDAAACVAMPRATGTPLCFTGLRTLSPEIALSLARGIGELSFPSLTRIDAQTASALSTHKGELTIGAMNNLDVSVAHALSTTESALRFPVLQNLTLDLAKAFSKHDGPLVLNGITQLSPAIAEVLVHHRGSLGLSGLKAIDASLAHVLAGFRGHLILDGIASLPEEVAAYLGDHSGWLSLQGLSAVTFETALHLSRHEGPLFLGTLKGSPPEAISVLRQSESCIIPHQ
jgi:hypothetical protein